VFSKEDSGELFPFHSPSDGHCVAADCDRFRIQVVALGIGTCAMRRETALCFRMLRYFNVLLGVANNKPLTSGVRANAMREVWSPPSGQVASTAWRCVASSTLSLSGTDTVPLLLSMGIFRLITRRLFFQTFGEADVSPDIEIQPAAILSHKV